MSQNLFFNILTFDWPKEPVKFYFTDKNPGFGTKIHSSLFPKEIKKIFPELSDAYDTYIYSTFNRESEGFKSLDIDFKNDNPDLIKRYYNGEIFYYFAKVLGKRVRNNFINDNQIWHNRKNLSTDDWALFDKYSIKVQLGQVSEFPELIISYDGQSRILKNSVNTLLSKVKPNAFNWLIYQGKFIKWEDTPKIDAFNSLKAYPVLNKELEYQLDLDIDFKKPKNKYRDYLSGITHFVNTYLLKEEFKKFIPINSENFLSVPPNEIDKCAPKSNYLLFGQKQLASDTKLALSTLYPYKNSIYSNIHIFFIYHEHDLDYRDKVEKQLREGMGNFRGLKNYVNLDFYTDFENDIIFSSREDPYHQIKKIIEKRDWDPAVKYMAVYITPISKTVKERSKKKIYYQLKELLLYNNIVSQVIDPEKMNAAKDNWKYSLPNIAIAMLAKLDGIPWTLANAPKTELIVGIGAYTHKDEGVQYIGSAFSFSSTGKFNNFDYFLKSHISLLAGSIADKVSEYALHNGNPERIVIHFYKEMSKRERDVIISELEKLGKKYLVIIVTVNKTESEDIVAFSNDNPDLMPPGGTFVSIGKNRYILFNNNYVPGERYSLFDGFPFPIKLKIQCTDPAQIESVTEKNELIRQVYQFSRLYYKSVSQQNLPVTVKYPEMVAEMAPFFVDGKIPPFGKDKLWFL